MREVHVVPHTHWDREWYEPYPTFRLKLVDLIDELLPRLEADPRFAHFQLDGQMAVVDDYLGLRPAEEDRLRSLASEGRLSMGPWYVLPDEFLVSGETHVRNLQLGIARAADFGGAMEVGYLPDMFGHVAQMPQLLSLFGFTDAVVWRGVPEAITAPAFWWEAPDGSRVRAEYLPAGYGNGSNLPPDGEGVLERVDAFVRMQGPLAGDPVLLMAGMDHEVPPAHLTDAIDDANALARKEEKAGDEAEGRRAYHLRMTSLAEHLAAAPEVGLPLHRGELRSGFRANLLMGVASNRVDVKAAAARAERALERHAEPLAALWLDRPERWRPVLASAWLEVIRNAAHDSICACSHDEVVEAVLHRYHEATRMADGIAERAVAAATPRFANPGPVVLNPGSRTRSGLVELDVPDGVGDESSLQVLAESPAREELCVLDAADAPMAFILDVMESHPDIRLVAFADDADGALRVDVLTAAEVAPNPGAELLDTEHGLVELGRRCAQDPQRQVRIVLWRHDPSRRVLTLSGPVPALGWRHWEPVAPEHPVAPAGELGLSNGLVDLRVGSDGGWSVNRMPGPARLVDSGDVGDTYNWCPPEQDTVVDAPLDVTVERIEEGPIRGRVRVTATYRWPERAEGSESRVGSVDVEVTTTLELRADEPFVRATVELDNRARDHRLRLHLPLPERAHTSAAECAYAVVERPLWAEGGPGEWGVPTFPSRRFVSAGGLTVTHEGLCEYELVDLDGPAEGDSTTAGELAVTLVRSTGWLSRPPMASRPLPAGPYHQLEGAQLQRPLSLRFAVHPHLAGALDPHELAERCWVSLPTVEAPGGGELADTGSVVDIRTDPADAIEVDAVFRDEDGRLVIRLHETRGVGAEVRVAGAGAVVDLRGREVEPFRDRVAVGPNRIVTLRLDGAG